jgi:hypothetical protein
MAARRVRGGVGARSRRSGNLGNSNVTRILHGGHDVQAAGDTMQRNAFAREVLSNECDRRGAPENRRDRGTGSGPRNSRAKGL